MTFSDGLLRPNCRLVIYTSWKPKIILKRIILSTLTGMDEWKNEGRSAIWHEDGLG